jgi:hypothetical protein
MAMKAEKIAYSRGIIILKAFASAMLQSVTSPLILETIKFTVDMLFRKMHAFLSCQISHDTNMAKEAIALLD